MKRLNTPTALAFAAISGIQLVGLTGCENDDMNSAADEVGQAAQNTADNIEEGAEEVADEIDDATDDQ